MASRAFAQIVAQDEEGNDLENAVVAFTNLAGAALGQSLYAAQSGGAPETVHQTNDLGTLDRYVDVPSRARYTVNGGVSRVVDFSPQPADVFVASDTQARTLDGYTGTDPVLTLRSMAASGTGLHVANVNNDQVVRVTRASSNDVVIVGTDGVTPTTAAFYVTKPSITVSAYAAARVRAIVSAPSLTGISGLEVNATQTVAGSSEWAAGRFTATKGAGASSAAMAAVKAVVVSGVASGDARHQVGLWATSSSGQSSTGLVIDGPGGWANLIAAYNAAGTLVFSVSGTGALSTAGNLVPATTSTYLIGLGNSLNWLDVRADQHAATSAGTAGNNVFYRWNDAGTGIHFPAATTFAIATGTVERLRVGASGLIDFRDTANQVVALGGGASASLGTIGTGGPVTAAQGSWLKVLVTGSARFIPLWV